MTPDYETLELRPEDDTPAEWQRRHRLGCAILLLTGLLEAGVVWWFLR